MMSTRFGIKIRYDRNRGGARAASEEENGGEKRGVGRGGAHFKGGQRHGEEGGGVAQGGATRR
jgi:hypothetical protein